MTRAISGSRDRCLGCRDLIRWIPLAGRWHPAERTELRVVVCPPDGDRSQHPLTVIVEGAVVRARLALPGDPPDLTRGGRESHFAYCKQAKNFRRR